MSFGEALMHSLLAQDQESWEYVFVHLLAQHPLQLHLLLAHYCHLSNHLLSPANMDLQPLGYQPLAGALRGTLKLW